ncbi:AAA family ATPase [Alkalicoccus luteus]|uniref:Nuclease SbcCD subunit C n=1 Tax=Alkalicoccus luteus TaxID=1237094 RepID=A0A969TWI8_9BACI|nr:SMC family ATPase [Alkalicoccus luteus]NJP37314.1 SMC family ATPase [Alkalicoccus luteus]
MRPLKLTIKGLHSFRAEQYVDFEALAGSGVFGIFGPTGSGKSSILDALTLALYAKVERAQKFDGIMNQHEKEIYVRFDFMLGNDAYAVERNLKKDKDGAVRQTSARFMCNSLVEAEKAKDVNEAVGELLGLSSEDFTRAVVLPQGKFAEFLSLKGQDRRKMLQRLFQLERYGDELNRKVSASRKQIDASLKQLESEKDGLGAADEHAVEEAAGALREAEDEKNLLTRLHKKADELAGKLADRWNKQHKLDEAKHELNLLQQKEDEMQEKKDWLERARLASRLKPFADEWTEANQAQQSIEEFYKQAEIGLQEAERKRIELITHAEQKKKELEQLKREKETVILKLEALQNTDLEKSQHEKQLREINDELEAGLKLEQKEEKELQAADVKFRQAKQLQEQLERDVQVYDEQLKPLAELRAACEEAESVRQLEKKANEKAQTLEESEKRRSLTAAAATDQESNQLAAQNQLKLTGSQLMAAYNKVSEIVHHIHTHFVSSQEKQWITTHRELVERGSPCPICGHSSLAASNKTSSRQTEDFPMQKLLKIRSDIEVRIESSPVLLPETKYQEEEPDLSHIEEKMQAWQRLISVWQQQMKEHQNVSQAYRDLIQRLQAEDQSVKEAQAAYSSARDEFQMKQKKWRQNFREYSLDTVAEEYQTLSELKEKRDYTAERIRKSYDIISSLQTKRWQISEKKTASSTKIHQLRDKERDLHERIAVCKDRIKAVAGDEPLQDKLLQEKQALIKYRSKLEKLDEEITSAAEEAEEKRLAYHSALERKTASEERIRRAEQAWRDHAGERAPEDVLLAYAEPSAVEEQAEAVQQFEEKMKLMADRVSSLQKEIGTPVTKDAWMLAEERKTALRSDLRYAEHAEGRAYQLYEDRAKRFERYAEVVKEEKRLRHEAELHQQLEQVLRGKQFVEFLAEEHLYHVCREATDVLKKLTRSRYAIEVDQSGGFLIRDDSSGGIRRPVSSLSGGETFLTSLALALALSKSIQLKGRYPLEFFFLDEGFGTLDSGLLETVMEALEKLELEAGSVGVISHVPELQERLQKRLRVIPAVPGETGTKLVLDT